MNPRQQLCLAHGVGSAPARCPRGSPSALPPLPGQVGSRSPGSATPSALHPCQGYAQSDTVKYFFIFLFFFQSNFPKTRKALRLGSGARSRHPRPAGLLPARRPARPLPGLPVPAMGAPAGSGQAPHPGNSRAASRRSIVSGTAKKRQESTAARAVSFFFFI